MADIYEKPIVRPVLLAEATSMGAALAGGIGVGMFPDFNLAESLTPIVDQVDPDLVNKPIYDHLYDIFNQAYDAFEPLFEKLTEK